MKDSYPEFTKQKLGEFLDRANRYIPWALAAFFSLGAFLGVVGTLLVLN